MLRLSWELSRGQSDDNDVGEEKERWRLEI